MNLTESELREALDLVLARQREASSLLDEDAEWRAQRDLMLTGLLRIARHAGSLLALSVESALPIVLQALAARAADEIKGR